MLEKIKKYWIFISIIIIVVFFALKVKDGLVVHSLKKEIKTLEVDKKTHSQMENFWKNRAEKNSREITELELALKSKQDSIIVIKRELKYVKKYYDEKIVNVDGLSLNTSVLFITNYYGQH